MKKILLALGIALVALLICAWYLRASIYWDLGKAGVYQPADFAEFTIGDASLPQLTYVAIGDSLTAGVGVDTYLQSYPYVLAQKIADNTRHVHLKPFAVPGVRSAYVLDHFIEPAVASKPDIVTLFIGVNDIHGNVPVREFKEHYAHILERLTQETDAEVYALALPYIGTSELISLPYRYYFNWRTHQYNAMIATLAEQYGVTFVDIYTVHQPHALEDAYYATDFFHPNAVGYRLWAESIYADFRK